jgi:TetR/AcrR family transcriptional repressor of nem operon
MAQACEHAMNRSLDALRQAAGQGGENALAVVASTYLSGTHRDHPADGCMLAALGAEAARHDSPVRSVFTRGVHSVVDALTQVLPGKSRGKKHERALAIYASMIGAIVVARAVDDPDLSEEVLKSVLASITPPNSP